MLEGDGLEGRGEDVAYDAADQASIPADLPLAGRWSLAELSAHLDGLDLFPRPLIHETVRDYRRWGFESAALDLALRRAGRSLGAALGLSSRPVRFVISPREGIAEWLAIDPTLELKLDPLPGWTRATIEALAATGRARVLDFKGHYHGTDVDVEPDPELYRRVAEAFPDAILEDPALTPACREALRGQEARIAWDAPVHSVADLDQLPAAGWLNVKPSRIGTLRGLFEVLEASAARGIRCYGGGQFELGVGRRQIQTLASLFYADGPNDVAPVEYHAPGPRAGLPRSPLPPPAGVAGFGAG